MADCIHCWILAADLLGFPVYTPSLPCYQPSPHSEDSILSFHLHAILKKHTQTTLLFAPRNGPVMVLRGNSTAIKPPAVHKNLRLSPVFWASNSIGFPSILFSRSQTLMKICYNKSQELQMCLPQRLTTLEYQEIKF